MDFGFGSDGWKERKAKLLGLDAPIKIDQRSINFTIEFDNPGQPPLSRKDSTVTVWAH